MSITLKGVELSVGIIEGPDRKTLFNAFENTYNSESPAMLKFKIYLYFGGSKSAPIGGTQDIKVRVKGIEYEDKTGERFRLRGECEADFGENLQRYDFEAFYVPDRQFGAINFR